MADDGALRMELSTYLQGLFKDYYRKTAAVEWGICQTLEVIPCQICDNSGSYETSILNKLWAWHAQRSMWYRVNINNEDIPDNFEAFVWSWLW